MEDEVVNGNFDLHFGDSDDEFNASDDDMMANMSDSQSNDHDGHVNQPTPGPSAPPTAPPTSKKFASLSAEDISEIEESVKAKGTTKQTAWSVKMFRRWLVHRGHDEAFEDLEPRFLEPLLRRFYAEVRTEDGNFYSKSAFVGIRAGLSRHLRNPPHNKRFNILVDPEFQVSNNTFKAMLRKLKQEGLDVSRPYPPLAPADLKKLRNSDALGPNTGLSLMRKVWFDLTLGFLRRGNENQSELKLNSFVVKTDAYNKQYIEMAYNEHTKNHPGDVNTVQTRPRVYETGTALCPVSSFLKYKSLRPPDCQALYLKPRENIQSSDTIWYTSRPLGPRKLEEMMKTLSSEAGLSQIYTNHSVRSTGITMLAHARVENQDIMRISGHRNEASLKSYRADASEDQKQHYSSILTSGLDSETDSTVTSSLSRSSVVPTDQLMTPGLDLHNPQVSAPAHAAVVSNAMSVGLSAVSNNVMGSHTQFKIDNSTVHVYNYTITPNL